MRNKTIGTLIFGLFLTQPVLAVGLLDDGSSECGPLSGINCIGYEDIDMEKISCLIKTPRDGGPGYAAGCAAMISNGVEICGELIKKEVINNDGHGDPKDPNDGKDDAGKGGSSPDIDADSDVDTDIDVDVDIDVDTETDTEASSSGSSSTRVDKKVKRQKAKQRKIKRQKKQRRELP